MPVRQPRHGPPGRGGGLRGERGGREAGGEEDGKDLFHGNSFSAQS